MTTRAIAPVVNSAVAELEAAISAQLKKSDQQLRQRARSQERRDRDRVAKDAARQAEAREEVMQNPVAAEAIRRAEAAGCSVMVDNLRNLPKGLKTILGQVE